MQLYLHIVELYANIVAYRKGINMIIRQLWLNRIENAWQKHSIIWLPGVRRAGKTSVCKSIKNCEYFDCELPRIRRLMEDPEDFFQNLGPNRIVLDEIHRLPDPSELLKIAADHFPHIKIIATGSSTLSASKKFKDTLTGRKTKIWLSPLLLSESELFGSKKLEHRLLHGGLPPFFISKDLPEEDFNEWLDDYWAKDIQELFSISNKYSFQRFTELIMANSGNLFEATKFATPCEVSRTTINKYLHILDQTFVAHIIKPFTNYINSEIVSAPKVYGFDTGFVCHHKHWNKLRQEDYGILLEHIVLNELLSQFPSCKLQYWRDKAKHEIDFIFFKNRRQQQPTAIECKWSANNFNPKNLHKFRSRYPDGNNFVITNDINKAYTRNFDDIKVTFINIHQLVSQFNKIE